jgi:hypothetical protein
MLFGVNRAILLLISAIDSNSRTLSESMEDLVLSLLGAGLVEPPPVNILITSNQTNFPIDSFQLK